ncbi:MAG: DsbA family protein [Anaerolineae bacterium]|nr:DsbA family protein [Anaerolineae bacterium]
MGRTRTVERRKEREQQRKRQRQMTIVIGLVVVAVAAAVLLFFISQPAEAPIPEVSAARYEGLPQSTTEEGFPKVGSDDAPVKVVEYSSFDCSHCREFHETVMTSIMDRVRAGEVQFTFIPVYGTGGIANGQGAAQAAVCAGQQGKFWEMQDALFTWQGLYANTAFSANRLSTGAGNLGLDVSQWSQCVTSTFATDVVTAAVDAGQLQNIPGTPAVFVNGTIVQTPDLASVNTAIDQALVGQAPAQIEPSGEATPEVTAEATTDAASEVPDEATPEVTAEATAGQ